MVHPVKDHSFPTHRAMRVPLKPLVYTRLKRPTKLRIECTMELPTLQMSRTYQVESMPTGRRDFRVVQSVILQAGGTDVVLAFG